MVMVICLKKSFVIVMVIVIASKLMQLPISGKNQTAKKFLKNHKNWMVNPKKPVHRSNP